MNSVKVVLMCGGIGKRMSPITTDKALFKFWGKPLIVHQINSAREAGISQFIIIANPENITDIRSCLSGIDNIKIDFVLQKKPLGMANALLSASDLIGVEPFILISSNDIFETSAY